MKNYIYTVLMCIIVFMFYVGLKQYFGTDLDIDYIPYTVKEGDTMFNIVVDHNEKVDVYYDPRDLVVLMREKNDIEGYIYPGETYYVPVILDKNIGVVSGEER